MRRRTSRVSGSPRLRIVARDGKERAPKRGGRGVREPLEFPVIVEFARGRATPRIESLKAMHRCAQWLMRRPRERVTVVGHANNRGWEKAADALARARVAAVTDLMTLLGADSQQFVAVAATRLHSVQVASTKGERMRKRVVVLHRHQPPQGIMRALAGSRAH